MRIGDFIYNLDGQPFRTVNLAERMRVILEQETGRTYRFDACPGGYRLQQEHQHAPAAVPVEPAMEKKIVASELQNPLPLPEYALRPAVFRTNLLALLLMGVAMVGVLMPDRLIATLLSGFHSRPENLGVWWLQSQTALSFAGGVVLILIWLSLLWQRANALYRVTAFGVEARLGLIANQTIGLRYQDIRSMTVKQSLPDRLLGVGLVEFTSAGSDGMPVQFRQIAQPNRVLTVVKQRMSQVASPD